MLKHDIMIVTSTRADYFLLKPTIQAIHKHPYFNLMLVVTGTHLLAKYGNTVDIIENEFPIYKRIYMQLYSDKPQDISRIIGQNIIDYSEIFEIKKPHMLLLLGDRYEILAPAIVAIMFNVKIAHMCGGDITEGAYDDYIRNTITMMSHIHFPTSLIAEQRILNFGKTSVIVAGHPCLEKVAHPNFKNLLPKRNDIEQKYNIIIPDNKNILVILHPETLSSNFDLDLEQFMKFIYYLIDQKWNLFILGTNIDTCNTKIREEIQKLLHMTNVYSIETMEQDDYLALASYCNVYVGNSSSGIYELPYFVPAIINVGNRQKGRLCATNIINTSFNYDDLINVFNTATSSEFLNNELITYYQSFPTSEIIVNKLLDNCC